MTRINIHKDHFPPHYMIPASYLFNSAQITPPTLALLSLVTRSNLGSFSYANQVSKFNHWLKATQTLVLALGLPLTYVRILQQARMDFQRSEKQPPRLVQRADISPKDSLPYMAFLMERKYFSCQRQPLLTQLKWSQLGQKWAIAFQSKRQRQFGDFLRIFSAILRTVAWNLMMKQMKISSLFLEIAKSFLSRQNSFAIQLPMLLIDRRYYTNFLGSVTLGAKTLESHIQCHDALS